MKTTFLTILGILLFIYILHACTNEPPKIIFNSPKTLEYYNEALIASGLIQAEAIITCTPTITPTMTPIPIVLEGRIKNKESKPAYTTRGPDQYYHEVYNDMKGHVKSKLVRHEGKLIHHPAQYYLVIQNDSSDFAEYKEEVDENIYNTSNIGDTFIKNILGGIQIKNNK